MVFRIPLWSKKIKKTAGAKRRMFILTDTAKLKKTDIKRLFPFPKVKIKNVYSSAKKMPTK